MICDSDGVLLFQRFSKKDFLWIWLKNSWIMKSILWAIKDTQSDRHSWFEILYVTAISSGRRVIVPILLRMIPNCSKYSMFCHMSSYPWWATFWLFFPVILILRVGRGGGHSDGGDSVTENGRRRRIYMTCVCVPE